MFVRLLETIAMLALIALMIWAALNIAPAVKKMIPIVKNASLI